MNKRNITLAEEGLLLLEKTKDWTGYDYEAVEHFVDRSITNERVNARPPSNAAKYLARVFVSLVALSLIAWGIIALVIDDKNKKTLIMAGEEYISKYYYHLSNPQEPAAPDILIRRFNR